MAPSTRPGERRAQPPRPACRAGGEGGFTYVWMLFVVALAGIVLAGAAQVWKTETQRERETELLFVGEQFREAIGSYYENSPSAAKRFPASQEELLADRRFPAVRRHLRRIYLDPMTGRAEWGLIIKPGIGLVGVHSLSTEKPIKRANFHERYAAFAEARNYREWLFVYTPGEAGGTPQPGSPPAAGTGTDPAAGAGALAGADPRPGPASRFGLQSRDRPGTSPLAPSPDAPAAPDPASPFLSDQ
ncbi:type II secretion system protein [Nitrosovibrio sp. Nv17]|uniref:type II secretion system protein n=1 Tax=Nitrosovibrio sp. Nv17 TaxID=1855339 RepID=UPI000908C458|nr:type II secretion system protein [Nitrosovibrio sp. Nv17]SFW37790.1 Type II secretory pathway, pseudopilin PulG [Nitrosovibrio sp. Nv17]